MRLVQAPIKNLCLIAALTLAPAGPASASLVAGVVAIEQASLPPSVQAALPRAKRGDSDAQYEIGTAYHEGRGLARDYAEAARWWRKAAARGHVDAQYNLGVMYHRGQGIRQDRAEAALWWRKAAEQGHAEAQYNLGLIYASGRGVPVDYKEAAKWYRMAAVQGGEKAQYNLGVLYAKGDALPANYIQALMWFSVAAAASPPGELRDKAAYNRDIVASRLTPEEVGEAQRLAQELIKTAD
jgi:TPR repeat protein